MAEYLIKSKRIPGIDYDTFEHQVYNDQNKEVEFNKVLGSYFSIEYDKIIIDLMDQTELSFLEMKVDTKNIKNFKETN